MNIAVHAKVLLSMAFVFRYFNLVFAKPLYPEMPFLRSQPFNLPSRGQEFKPGGDAIEPVESIRRESNHTSNVNRFLESPAAHNRTARNTHWCVSVQVREFDSCRNTWVAKVQCKRSHPICSHVVRTHGTPKCQPVYGYRNATFVTKCPSLPIDCQCAV